MNKLRVVKNISLSGEGGGFNNVKILINTGKIKISKIN